MEWVSALAIPSACWDSNRFLEAFFAVPTMGAVLQIVNVRLPPEQIAYTISHAGSSMPSWSTT
jgi:acyl-CoA synthetase (AMP-forming)/AMP-acid ligase II